MSSHIAERQLPQWTLTDRLRKARELAGMEQKEFAEALGVARSTIVRYEHGQTKPQRALLRAWAALAEVPFEWLTEGLASGSFGGGLSSKPPLPRLDLNQEPAGSRSVNVASRNVMKLDGHVFRTSTGFASPELLERDLQAA